MYLFKTPRSYFNKSSYNLIGSKCWGVAPKNFVFIYIPLFFLESRQVGFFANNKLGFFSNECGVKKKQLQQRSFEISGICPLVFCFFFFICPFFSQR